MLRKRKIWSNTPLLSDPDVSTYAFCCITLAWNDLSRKGYSAQWVEDTEKQELKHLEKVKWKIQ